MRDSVEAQKLINNYPQIFSLRDSRLMCHHKNEEFEVDFNPGDLPGKKGWMTWLIEKSPRYSLGGFECIGLVDMLRVFKVGGGCIDIEM